MEIQSLNRDAKIFETFADATEQAKKIPDVREVEQHGIGWNGLPQYLIRRANGLAVTEDYWRALKGRV